MARIPSTMVMRAPEIPVVSIAPNMSSGNTSQQVIQMLLFNSTQSLATSTVVLTIFNTFAAALTMAIIIYDCWSASRARNGASEKGKRYFLAAIHPAEVFPLIVSVAVIIQGFVFAGIESMGLSNYRVSGCTRISEFVWIAFWLVPITIQVFAAETAVRALRNPRFPARGKRSVPICLIAVLVLIILTWIPSKVFPAGDSCIASLTFYIRNKGRAGVVTISLITVVILTSLVIIIVQLSRNAKIAKGERIAASRMVYYLIVTTIIMAFAFPYFVERTKNKNSDVANMMATIALNIWGLTNSFLHLFLRANANSTAIRPSALSWSKENRRTIFGPSDLSPASDSTETAPLRRSSTDRSFQSGTEKFSLFVPPAMAGSPSKTSFTSPPGNTPSSARGLAPLSLTSPEVVVTQPTSTSSRTPLYSPFPRRFSRQSLPPPLPALPQPDDSHSPPSAPANESSNNTALTIPHDDLTLPSRASHPRFSVASSATVQIGLRISNAIAMGLSNIPGPNPIPAPLRVPGAQKMLPPTPTGEDALPRPPEAAVTTESGLVKGEPRASMPNETWI